MGRFQIDFTVGRMVENQIPAFEVWGLIQESGGIGDQYGPGSMVHLDGTISLKFDGEELLGPEYWLEFFSLIHLSPLGAGKVDEASERVWSTGHSGELRFRARPARDLVDYTLLLDGEVRCMRPLPLRPLVDAWTYLRFRLYRLAAELGDETAISATKYGGAYFPDGFLDGANLELITHATHAPLEEVLCDPKLFG